MVLQTEWKFDHLGAQANEQWKLYDHSQYLDLLMKD